MPAKGWTRTSKPYWAEVQHISCSPGLVEFNFLVFGKHKEQGKLFTFTDIERMGIKVIWTSDGLKRVEDFIRRLETYRFI